MPERAPLSQSERQDRVARVAAAVKAATDFSSGDRPADRGHEIGVRYEYTVPGVRIIVEALRPADSEPPCATCYGQGRIDLNADWYGPPGVERHHWHPCPDCDTPVRAL